MMFPVDKIVAPLKLALSTGSVAIVVAEPGAGKTTRIPLALYQEPWLRGKKILMLEPRRLAVRTAARRMAETLGEEVGEQVGYRVRLESKNSPRTRIEVITEGILTRRLQSDPELSDVGLIIFDEFHERSLDGDLGLALVRDVQQALRPDLRLLIMSATLESERLAQYLGDAPVLSAEGRQFGVTTHYLDKAQRTRLAADTARAIQQVLHETTGSLLVFLPGEAEIRKTASLLQQANLSEKILVTPLYGAMRPAEQDAALLPCPPGFRKIVLTTTLAETSLTIEGITTVVDTGYKRKPRFDPASGMSRLETVRVSLASADQRRGRAGRLGPGRCYRLWPEAETRALLPFDPPEILVSDLCSLVLELAAWGVTQVEGLSWLDSPPGGSFAQGQDLLRHLQALDSDNQITAMGRAMVKLPLHPRLAHMVLRAQELGAGYAAAELAAYLSERDGGQFERSVNITPRLAGLSGALRGRVGQAAKQIRQMAGISEKDTGHLSDGVMVAFAWPDRIAQSRKSDRRYRMSRGGGAQLPEHDGLSSSDYLAIALTDGTSGDQKIFLAASLELVEIEEFFRDLIVTCDKLVWDGRAEQVVAARQRRLDELVLSEKPLASPDPEKVSAALLAGIQQMGLRVLPWHEGVMQFRAQVAFLRRHFAEVPWPDFSDEALFETLGSWLLPYLAGMTRRSHLEKLDLLAILRSLLPYELLRQIDQLAPRSLTIPSGTQARIDYDAGDDPVIRVRLQEMFGLTTTPRLAQGRVPLKIELLSPAGRPLAVTKSLETFWTNAYPDVRAELRGRYPKHSWPEDPRTAIALKPRQIR